MQALMQSAPVQIPSASKSQFLPAQRREPQAPAAARTEGAGKDRKSFLVSLLAVLATWTV
jgi:hypothetical protein